MLHLLAAERGTMERIPCHGSSSEDRMISLAGAAIVAAE